MSVLPFSTSFGKSAQSPQKTAIPFSQFQAPPAPPAPADTQQSQPKQNIFQRIGSGIKNFATGVAQSEIDTAHGIGSLLGLKPTKFGSSVLSSADQPAGMSKQAGNIAGTVAQFIAPSGIEKTAIEKGVSLLPKAGEIFTDAAGKLSKVGKAAEYGISSLVHGIGGGAVTTAQSGNLKQGLETGGLIGLSETPIAIGGKLLGGILKNTASFVSGKGRDVINAIVSDPETALKGLSENTAEGLSKSVLAVKKFASDTYEAVKDRYDKGLQEIEAKYLPSNKPFMKQGVNIIAPKGVTIPLTLKGVKDSIKSVFNDFGVDGDFTKGFDFSNAPSVNLKTVLNKVYSSVKNFSDITPTGLTNLTRRLQAIAENTKLSEAIAAANKIASNIRTYIGERIPEIKALNADYTRTSKFLEDLDTALSTGVKGDIKAGMNSLEGVQATASKLAGIFGKDKEIARQFIASIPGGSKWIAEQAGRTIAEGQKLSGFAGEGNMLNRALESAIPPKLTGWMTAQGAQLSKLLPKLNPAEQAIIKELVQLAGGSSQPNNQNSPLSQIFPSPQ